MNEVTAGAMGDWGNRDIEGALHLQQGVELLQQAIKGIPLVVAVQDEQLRFLWFYNELPHLQGQVPLGKRDADIMVRPEDAERVEAVKRRVLETGNELHEEMVVFDGHDERYYDLTVKPLLANGRVSGVTSTAYDITEHVRTAQLWREAEKRASRQAAELAALLTTAPIGLAIFDEQLRYVYINDRLAEINGLPALAHIGRTVREMVPGLADEAEVRFRRVLDTGDPLLNLEVSGETARQPGVRRTWVEHSYPIKNEQGQAVALSLMVEEITERKKVEAEREQRLVENAYHQALLQELNDSLEHQVVERTEQLRQVALALMGAEQQERSRLAMELHDSVGQLLTVLTINLHLIANDLPEELSEVNQQLQELAELTTQIHEEVRTISHSMRPIALKDSDLNSALESLARDFGRRTAIKVAYEGMATPVDEDMAVVFYRFLQEALTNVARHAEASKVWVALSYNDGVVSLSVRDDGVGFEIQQNGPEGGDFVEGMGLQSLYQRFQFLGGRVVVESQKGGGTRIEAQLKLKR